MTKKELDDITNAMGETMGAAVEKLLKPLTERIANLESRLETAENKTVTALPTGDVQPTAYTF
jgi:hypothetical protein